LLDLSRCTLLFVETRAHKITERVIADCLSKANFGDILIYTDKPELIPVAGARYEHVPDFPNKKLAGQFYYGQAMAKVETDFALMLEWDGGIFDASKWRPEFFDYDYIGAPWVVRPGDPYPVGNGGFTLMSRKLGHFVNANLRAYPVSTDWDFCRVQRPNYERNGFKWPSAELASFFSWELGPRNPDHFGYHGAFTWPYVLTKDECLERAHIMVQSDYLVQKLSGLVKEAPWIEQALDEKDRVRYQAATPPGRRLRPTIPNPAAMMTATQRAQQQLIAIQRRGQIMRQQETIREAQSKGLKA